MHSQDLFNFHISRCSVWYYGNWQKTESERSSETLHDVNTVYDTVSYDEDVIEDEVNDEEADEDLNFGCHLNFILLSFKLKSNGNVIFNIFSVSGTGSKSRIKNISYSKGTSTMLSL